MDNMNNDNIEKLEKLFTRHKEHHHHDKLSDNFESQVLYKIKRKKTQRKITVGASTGVLLFVCLFLVQGVVFHKSIDNTFASGQQSVMNKIVGTGNHTGAISGQKEEIPVTGEVVFYNNDNRNSYSVRQVSYSGNNSSI